MELREQAGHHRNRSRVLGWSLNTLLKENYLGSCYWGSARKMEPVRDLYEEIYCRELAYIILRAA